MKLSDLVSMECQSKHRICEHCHKGTDLKLLKVKTFDGMFSISNIALDAL